MKIKVDNAGGFGNRLYAWETMYEISKINNAKLQSDFTELEYITLPNTEYIDYSISSYNKFNSNDIFPNFILDKNYNYSAICGFGFNRYFNQIHNKTYEFPKQQMQLNNKKLHDKIKYITNGVVGVHIRRGEAGHGSHDYFNPSLQGVSHYPYGTIPDFWYFSLMKKIQQYNPKLKFYLSSDNTNKDELVKFYDNFDIITYEDIVATSSNYWKTPSDYLLSIKNNEIRNTDLAGIVDLFALANCKLLICSVSTWTMTAYEMGKLPTYWPELRNQELDSLKLYRNTINEKSIKIQNIL